MNDVYVSGSIFVKDDFVCEEKGKGLVVNDKTTGRKYRIIVDKGKLELEPILVAEPEDI